MAIVLPPMRDSFFTSDREATPMMSEPSTRGTAMTLSRFRKMSPKGVIQSSVNWLQPMAAESNPYNKPRIMPMMIFQCRGRRHRFIWNDRSAVSV